MVYMVYALHEFHYLLFFLFDVVFYFYNQHTEACKEPTCMYWIEFDQQGLNWQPSICQKCSFTAPLKSLHNGRIGQYALALKQMT